ncbi:MAG: hypothetical protein HY980_03975 [Candidatus Magasanikbacteria bacterium]|nr:hypothetical protein [Candidatus Magasanikbacteria bacterium]
MDCGKIGCGAVYQRLAWAAASVLNARFSSVRRASVSAGLHSASGLRANEVRSLSRLLNSAQGR